jgi:hypothetical protein
MQQKTTLISTNSANRIQQGFMNSSRYRTTNGRYSNTTFCSYVCHRMLELVSPPVLDTVMIYV